jgi:hypothetical protein
LNFRTNRNLVMSLDDKTQQQMIEDLVNEEKHFVDNLGIFVVVSHFHHKILQDYQLAFVQSKLVSEKNIKAIFNTIKLIYTIHSTLLQDLTKLKNPNCQETVGKIFLKFSPYLKSYAGSKNIFLKFPRLYELHGIHHSISQRTPDG